MPRRRRARWAPTMRRPQTPPVRRRSRGGGGRLDKPRDATRGPSIHRALAGALAVAIGSVRLHAEAALLRRLNAGAGFADPHIASQIYLRDAAALARLAGGTLRPQGTHHRAEAELAHAIAATGAADEPPPRLAILTERLGIDPVATGVLL